MDRIFKLSGKLTAIALAMLFVCVLSNAAFAQKLSPVQAPQFREQSQVQAPNLKLADPPQVYQPYSVPLPQLAPAPQIARVPTTTFTTVQVPRTQLVPVTTFENVSVPQTTFTDVPVNAAPVNLVARCGGHPVLHRITHPFEGLRSRSKSVVITKSVVRS